MAKKYKVLDLYVCKISLVKNIRADLVNFYFDLEDVTMAICKKDKNGNFVQLTTGKKFPPLSIKDRNKLVVSKNIAFVNAYKVDSHFDIYSLEKLAEIEKAIIETVVNDKIEELVM